MNSDTSATLLIPIDYSLVHSDMHAPVPGHNKTKFGFAMVAAVSGILEQAKDNRVWNKP